MIASFAPARAASLVRRMTLAAAVLLAALPMAAQADDAALVLHTSTGEHAFKVEVVDNDATRSQGLMYRTELAPDAGMLFDFKEERQTSFWMKNTLIPLDMVFVSADGVVRNIHVNARPLDLTGIGSKVPVQFVLEIPGGRSEEIGLKVGDRMDHDRVEK